MKIPVKFFLTIFLGMGCALLAEDTRWFTAGVQLWRADHELSFEGSGGRLAGTDVDADSDLGVDDQETITSGIVALNFKDALVRFSVYETELKGNAKLTKQVDFNDVTFSSGTDISAEIDMFEWAVTAESLFNPQEDLSWGWIFGVQYFSIESEIRSSGQVVSDDFEAPWIMPGLKLRKKLPLDMSFDASAQIFGLDFDDKQFFSTDLGATFRWQPHQNVNFDLGYRLLTIDGQADDFEFDYERMGPWVGLYVRF